MPGKIIFTGKILLNKSWKRNNEVIKDIQKNKYKGIGKPEPF